MKKIICLALSLLMLAAAAVSFASCTDGDGDSSKQTSENASGTGTSAEASANESTDTSAPEESSEESNPYVDKDGNYIVTNELKTWDYWSDVVNKEENEFSIIVRGTAAATYQSDDFTTGSELYGTTLDTAVTERNSIIESKYGIKLKIYKSDAQSDTIMDDIHNDIAGGTMLYDAIMPSIPGLAVLAQEGNLLDLRSFDSIHLDAPWWDNNANNTFSISSRLFFTTGDITILNKVNTSSILFNKETITTLRLEDPYELVNKHQWTYDKMKTMAKAATAETDSQPGMSCDDNWGLLASTADALTFYGAAGLTLCGKNGDDLPYLVLGEQRSIDVIQQILNDMAEPNTWVIYAQDFTGNIWQTSLDAFIDGRILFRPSAFSATTKLRKAGADFGIVPLPLWNEDQDEYCSYCGIGETAGVAISIGCANPEYSAYMLEAISCESKNYVTPAYMDINLKGKDMQDEESLEMLNIIFGNIIYDVGDVYAFGGIDTLFTEMVKNKNTNITSEFAKIKDTVEEKISDIIDIYSSID